MTTINPANFAFKDADGDLGQVKSLSSTDIILLNTALQDIEDLKLSVQNPAPVGSVVLLDSDVIPEGWLLCNGAAVSRMVYASLFEKLGTRHGAGNGSTTFNLPDFRDRYPIGAGTNTLGTKLAEQLPNVTGTVKASANGGKIYFFGGTIDGAFSFLSPLGNSLQGTASGITDRAFGVSLSAEKSNSIYADSGKVYPLSLALNYIIKA